jgi:hypothetical protein
MTHAFPQTDVSPQKQEYSQMMTKVFPQTETVKHIAIYSWVPTDMYVPPKDAFLQESVFPQTGTVQQTHWHTQVCFNILIHSHR